MNRSMTNVTFSYELTVELLSEMQPNLDSEGDNAHGLKYHVKSLCYHNWEHCCRRFLL